MVKITKKTIYYEGMPLRPLKMGKISILTGKNLAKKINIKKEKNNGKIKSNSGKKSKSVTKT